MELPGSTDKNAEQYFKALENSLSRAFPIAR